jgi:hypothetical protein
VTELLKPVRGGFLRPFGCGWFIREYLLGYGPHGSSAIDPLIGTPQPDIFHQYKMALMRATALDKATRSEEKRVRKTKRPIIPANIEKLAQKYLAQMPYKAQGCRFHSFVVYFSNIQRLGWVEATGREEPSAFQAHYPSGPPSRYFRLTKTGREASDDDWRNHHRALYS